MIPEYLRDGPLNLTDDSKYVIIVDDLCDLKEIVSIKAASPLYQTYFRAVCRLQNIINDGIRDDLEATTGLILRSQAIDHHTQIRYWYTIEASSGGKITIGTWFADMLDESKMARFVVVATDQKIADAILVALRLFDQ